MRIYCPEVECEVECDCSDKYNCEAWADYFGLVIGRMEDGRIIYGSKLLGEIAKTIKGKMNNWVEDLQKYSNKNDGSLRSDVPHLLYDGKFDSIELSGEFTIDEIETLARHMRKYAYKSSQTNFIR